MKIERIYAVYFSPTHGTQKYVEGIARRLGETFAVIDLTRPENRKKEYQFTDRDLVLAGAPVYAGRLPRVPEELFTNLRGDHTPCVCMVSYGNRDYDDALLEEKELLESRGFAGIGAAAWIAPHTFSDRIAKGRPDSEDEKKMDQFAGMLKKLLEEADWQNFSKTLRVKGNHPYKAVKSQSFFPAAREGCTGCGTCASVCPVGAIDPAHPRDEDTALCIDCFACVKNCPAHARNAGGPAYEALVDRLEKGMGLTELRREPEFMTAEE